MGRGRRERWPSKKSPRTEAGTFDPRLDRSGATLPWAHFSMISRCRQDKLPAASRDVANACWPVAVVISRRAARGAATVATSAAAPHDAASCRLPSSGIAAVRKDGRAGGNSVADDARGRENGQFVPGPDRARVIRSGLRRKKGGVTGLVARTSLPSPPARPGNASVRPLADRLCVAPDCASVAGAASAHRVR